MLDWFTLVAQLINFLILVWLLKRFLYKPILNHVDQREKHIASQLQEAENLKTEATTELENYRKKNSEFDQDRQELVNKTITEVNSERQKLLEQTRNEVEKMRLRLQESLKNEQENLSSEITRRTRTEVFSITRKVLVDLASVNLEDQIANVFFNRLNTLEIKEKEQFVSAIKNDCKEIVVRSTFELSSATKGEIKELLKNKYNINVGITYESDSNLVSGIELIAGGFKLVWSIDEYLSSLEKSISEILSVNLQSEPKT